MQLADLDEVLALWGSLFNVNRDGEDAVRAATRGVM